MSLLSSTCPLSSPISFFPLLHLSAAPFLSPLLHLSTSSLSYVSLTSDGWVGLRWTNVLRSTFAIINDRAEWEHVPPQGASCSEGRLSAALRWIMSEPLEVPVRRSSRVNTTWSGAGVTSVTTCWSSWGPCLNQNQNQNRLVYNQHLICCCPHLCDHVVNNVNTKRFVWFDKLNSQSTLNFWTNEWSAQRGHDLSTLRFMSDRRVNRVCFHANSLTLVLIGWVIRL